LKAIIPLPLLLILLLLTMLALTVVSMLVGPAGLGLSDLLSLWASDEQGIAALIMMEIRLPRTLLALSIGASLGISGAALQGLLRNPLAEPGVMGISGASALGAVIALYFGLSQIFSLALPVLAMVGAGLAVMVLQVLSARSTSLVVVLAGVAIASLTGALTSLALNFSANPFAAMEIIFWLLGSVTDRSMDHVSLALPFMIIGWVLLLFVASRLDVLSLGEDTAASLGVNLSQTRFLVILGCALCVGPATAVSGVIGFVGLVVPHLLRPLVGHQPGRLLIVSGLGGAVLLLLADIVVRLTASGQEMKLGVMTALVGAPFFLMLVIRARRQGTA